MDLVQYLALARGVGVRIGRIGAVKGEDVCRRFPAVLRHPRLGHVPSDVPRDAQPEAPLPTPTGVKVSGGLHRGDGGETLAKLGEVHLSVAILVEGIRQIVSGGLAAEGLALGQELIAIDLTVVVGVDRAKYGPLAWMRFLRIRGHRARAPSFVDEFNNNAFSTWTGRWQLARAKSVSLGSSRVVLIRGARGRGPQGDRATRPARVARHVHRGQRQGLRRHRFVSSGERRVSHTPRAVLLARRPSETPVPRGISKRVFSRRLTVRTTRPKLPRRSRSSNPCSRGMRRRASSPSARAPKAAARPRTTRAMSSSA